MITRRRRVYQAILTFIFVVVLLFLVCVGGNIPARAYAASPNALKYDQTNVLDDLIGSTIGGETFDLAKYPYNERGKPQIIAFSEYAYSFYSNRQDNYGLYVYVYNPSGLAYDIDTDRNKIELSYAGLDNWTLYTLQFLNYSTRAGYEGLFYKFKVVLSDGQKAAILSSVEQSSRIYEVIGIELSVDDVVEDYEVAMRFVYSGYSLGYGSALATESSLACDTYGIETYLNLDVYTTYYRPDGTNGENAYTQDSLHSVYFAVPKDIIAEYGAMSAVHATWLDVVLAPVLVTGNMATYNAIEEYLGQDIGKTADGLDYAYVGNADYKIVQWAGSSNIYGWTGPYGYNLPDSWTGLVGGLSMNKIERTVSPLYWLIYSGSKENSADEYVLSSEEIQQKLVEYTAKYGGILVNSRYSRVLFDSVADEFTDLNISADFQYDLRNEVLGSSWWDKLWGISYDYSDAFAGIEAIHSVSDTDFIYAGEEIDVAATSDNLLISEQDFAEFKDFYDANKDDSVIYLFRYQVSDYIASEATLFEPDNLVAGAWNKTGDSNAYFMQQTLNLDFNVIDVTFTKGNVSTVIPVVASPVDNVPDGTPPIHTEPDEDDQHWLALLFGLLALMIVLVVLWPILLPALTFLVKGVIWIFTLPFKAVSAIQKSLKKKPKDTGQASSAGKEPGSAKFKKNRYTRYTNGNKKQQ